MNYFTINSTIANVYRDPDFNSPVVSQGLLGETCLVRDRRESWIECQFPDGYQGWVNQGQGVLSGAPYAPTAICLDPFAVVADDARPVRSLALGCQVMITDEGRIILPDGHSGTSGSRFGSPLTRANRDAILTTARQFIGTPYIWGGRSSYGLDCSGLVQLTFFLCGITLPRDSRAQAEYESLKDVREEEMLPGDLYFFGKEQITHVGIYSGNHNLIHAQGYVKEESIDPGDPRGNQALSQTIQSVKSIESLL